MKYLDPVESTVRYEVMKLCTDYWVSKVQQWLALGGAEVIIVN